MCLAFSIDRPDRRSNPSRRHVRLLALEYKNNADPNTSRIIATPGIRRLLTERF
ncbi:MAG: hypothetical protein ACYCTV_03170 [Leptospirales bacterium]